MVGKNLDRLPWPQTRIFIEMDSTLGISKVIEMRSKIVPGHFCYFLALWLNLCNISDQTLFSNALTFARSLGSC